MWEVLPPWTIQTWCLANTGRQVCLLVVASGIPVQEVVFRQSQKCRQCLLQRRVSHQSSLSHHVLISKVAMRRYLKLSL